mmetsp:Transcript_6623/g.19453  ORF Transcript_6623/g.19453 Transcript_6623/m.19453 type:complete len:453 (+) Transcript_6623:275-1633(+)
MLKGGQEGPDVVRLAFAPGVQLGSHVLRQLRPLGLLHGLYRLPLSRLLEGLSHPHLHLCEPLHAELLPELRFVWVDLLLSEGRGRGRRRGRWAPETHPKVDAPRGAHARLVSGAEDVVDHLGPALRVGGIRAPCSFLRGGASRCPHQVLQARETFVLRLLGFCSSLVVALRGRGEHTKQVFLRGLHAGLCPWRRQPTHHRFKAFRPVWVLGFLEAPGTPHAKEVLQPVDLLVLGRSRDGDFVFGGTPVAGGGLPAVFRLSGVVQGRLLVEDHEIFADDVRGVRVCAGTNQVVHPQKVDAAVVLDGVEAVLRHSTSRWRGRREVEGVQVESPAGCRHRWALTHAHSKTLRGPSRNTPEVEGVPLHLSRHRRGRRRSRRAQASHPEDVVHARGCGQLRRRVQVRVHVHVHRHSQRRLAQVTRRLVGAGAASWKEVVQGVEGTVRAGHWVHRLTL